MRDVIVVGGGIVGAATAYHLARGGARTLLLDRGDRGRATDAGAGILSAETYTGHCDAWFDFAAEAAAYYPRLVEALGAFSDVDVGYGACAKLTVAMSSDELPRFEAAKRCVLERQRRGEGPPAEELREITPAQARARFPFLAEVLAGLCFARSARVDGRRLTAALLAAGRHHGVVERQRGVDELLLRGGRVEGVVAGGERFDADSVVVAGGAWSPSFERQLGVRIPVEPQRGQLVHLRVADTAAWPIIEGFRGHYIVPWPDGRVVAGATREAGSGFDARPTAAGLSEVLEEAFRAIPTLREAEILEARVGLRPLTPDRMPVLGRVTGIEGVWLATGHGSTGLQLGPYTGKVIADLVLRREAHDLGAFLIDRFQSDD
jgi:D-amino-acid dehydrogenase